MEENFLIKNNINIYERKEKGARWRKTSFDFFPLITSLILNLESWDGNKSHRDNSDDRNELWETIQNLISSSYTEIGKIESNPNNFDAA